MQTQIEQYKDLSGYGSYTNRTTHDSNFFIFERASNSDGTWNVDVPIWDILLSDIRFTDEKIKVGCVTAFPNDKPTASITLYKMGDDYSYNNDFGYEVEQVVITEVGLGPLGAFNKAVRKSMELTKRFTNE